MIMMMVMVMIMMMLMMKDETKGQNMWHQKKVEESELNLREMEEVKYETR